MANYEDERAIDYEPRIIAPKGSMSVDMTFTRSELAELSRFLSGDKDASFALSRDNINALVRRAIGNQLFISECQENGDQFYVKTSRLPGRTTYRQVNFL